MNITKEQAFDMLSNGRVFYTRLTGGEFKAYAIVKSASGQKIALDEQIDKDLLTAIRNLDWSSEKDWK